MTNCLKYIKSVFIASVFFTCTLAQAQPFVLDKIIAKVDNQIVLQSELEAAYKQFLAETKFKTNDVKCDVLETLIINKLLLAKAEIDSVTVDERMVEDQLDRRMQYFIASVGSEKKLESYYGKTVTDLKNDLRKQVRDQMVVQKMQDNITKKLKVTPGEVKKFFNNIPADSLPFYSKEVEVGQIVKIPKVNRQQMLEARSKLLTLKERILKGEKFEDLAKTYSDEPAAKTSGGNLGFQRSEDLDQSFVGAALKLKPGQISDVVESQFGLHIIEMIERRGSEFNSRHILIKPNSSSLDISEAKHFLDSIHTRISQDSATFETMAKNISEDKMTSSTGGLFVDQNTGSTHIPTESLDPVIFFIIDTMQVGKISAPMPFRTADGKDAVRIIWYKSKSDAHRANLKDDYQKIYNAALSEKKNKMVNEWFEKSKTEVFIEVKPEFAHCKVLEE